MRDHLVQGTVLIAGILGRAGDDQRRAAFVDQDGVDLVDDGEVEVALDHLLQAVLHVVAQVVEAELVVGAVGDVAGVLVAAHLVRQAVHDGADGQAEEAVDLPHPLGVALGQVVVHRDHVYALAGQRVEIDRERRHQGLALAGLHLGDLAAVQHHAADQLHVEVPLPERALGRLAHRGEGLDQEVVEILALGQSFAELPGARRERGVVELLQLRLQGVDRRDLAAQRLDVTVVGGTENALGDRAEHESLETDTEDAGGARTTWAAQHRRPCLRDIARPGRSQRAMPLPGPKPLQGWKRLPRPRLRPMVVSGARPQRSRRPRSPRRGREAEGDGRAAGRMGRSASR